MNTCVLVTGASHGIGKAIALEFAKAGYNVAITCRTSKKELLHLKNLIEETYAVTCLAKTGDIGEEPFVSQLIADVEKTFGRLDILVNNAGISNLGLLQDMSLEQWNRLLQTNLTSAFLCCKYSIPLMLKAHSGSILNISSVWGTCGASCEVAYSASKGGVNSFTKALAKELAPSNIRVNALACGAIDTRMNQFLSSEERMALESEIPLMRMGTVTEVGRSAVNIACNESYMTGQIITLDGGWCV